MPPTSSGDANAPGASGMPESLPYARLKQTHPEYQAKYWHRLRALYEGGRALLEDRALLEEIFPRHRDEHPVVYAERLRRAFYIPHAAEIVDHIVANLTSQELTMSIGQDADGKAKELPEFYRDFSRDTSPPGGRAVTLQQYVKDQVLCALQCRTAWALVDLPRPGQFANRAEQEKAGALDPYVVRLEPESVVDWREDSTGELQWVLVHTCENERADITSDREQVTERWTYYTPTAWAVYEITHKKNDSPKDDTVVPLVESGEHSFGRVTLLRFTLPPGLWAMNKLEGLARELLNKRAALAWGETQSLLPELYEFLGPEMASNGAVIGESQEDAGRATRYPRGQGYVQKRGHQDKAAFVGPDVGPFAHAIESCRDLRDEMHRVTHQMALTVDNSAAALKRSGESKAQDKAATAVVLVALGQLVREHAEALFNLLSSGRPGDAELVGVWSAKGMEKFDSVSISDAVEQATSLETISIPSPTFQRRHKLGLAKLVLGDEASPDDIDAIEGELEENITAEGMMAMEQAKAGVVPQDGEPPAPRGDEPGSDDEDEPPPQRRAGAGGGISYSSKG